MKESSLDPAPIRRLAPPMEIHVSPKRDFTKTEQFDPFQLAGKEHGFEMYHKDCGGRIELKLKEEARRVLFLRVSSCRWYQFVCTACQEAYEIELTGSQDATDECVFTQQCLRRVLVEKQGPYGSSLHLNFHYRKP